MKTRELFPRKKRLSILIALAVAGLSPQVVNALTLNATGEYSLGGGSTTTVSDGPSATSVDIIPYVTDADGNSVFFHVYGNSSNVFGSRSSGEGTFGALGTFTLQDTITNNTGAAGNFYLDYVITSGQLAVNCFTDTINCVGSARYDIDIKVNGTSVESATGDLTMDNMGTTLATTGFTLDGATQTGVGSGSTNANYSWSNTHRVANLGFFDVGDAFTLDYDLVTEATGAFGNDGTMNCYGEYGGDVLEPAIGLGDGGTSACPGGSAVARSGDPNNVTGPSVSNLFNTINPGIPPNGPAGGGVVLPEPGSLSLMGVGFLAAMAGLRRRRPRVRT